MRSAHLERAPHLTPAQTLYFRVRDDFDHDLAGRTAGFAQVSIPRLIMTLIKKRPVALELPEPLWLRWSPIAVLVVLIVRMVSVLGIPRPLLVSYAIDNLPSQRRPWPLRCLSRFCANFLAARLDRIAFGTQGAHEALNLSVKRRTAGRLAHHSTIIEALPAPCDCPTGRRDPHEVLFLGTLQQRKGFDLLLQAWSHGLSRNANYRLRVIGDGEMRHHLEEVSREDERVEVLGAAGRETVHAALRRAAIVVLASQPAPAWREQVGLPIVEALAHGCRVVASDETGLAPWLKDNGHTVVPTPIQPNGLAAALESALAAGPLSSNLPDVDGRVAADLWLMEGVASSTDGRDQQRPVRSPIARVMGLTLLSQITSAVGILLLPLLPRGVADAYSVGLQIGFAAFTSLSLGVTYNVAIGRPHFRRWRRHAVGVGIVSLALIPVPLVVVGSSHALSASWAAVVLLFGIGGALLAIGGVAAAYLACHARPTQMAAIAVPANIALAASLLVLLGARAIGIGLPDAFPAMCWFLTTAVGSVVVVWTARQHAAATTALARSTPQDTGEKLHMVSLVVGAITNLIIPSFLVAGAATMAAGTVTLLFLVIRLTSSLVALIVNSWLLVNYTWFTEKRFAGAAAQWAMLGAATGSISCVVAELLDQSLLGYGLLGIALALGLAGTAITAREVNKQRLARVLMSKGVLDLLASAAATAMFLKMPSPSGFLSAFLLSQAITTGIFCHALRLRAGMLASLVCGITCAVTILAAW